MRIHLMAIVILAAGGLSCSETTTVCPDCGAKQCADGSGDLGVQDGLATPDSGTGSWKTIRAFQFVLGKDSQCHAIEIDQQGYIYVGGSAQDPTGNVHSFVVISKDHGVTWTMSDDFQLDAAKHTYLFAMGIDGAGRVTSLGRGQGSVAGYQWLVRQYAKTADTWSTVDTFQLVTGKTASPLGLTSDKSGNIYVCGWGHNSSSIYNLVVRKSADSGKTWSTVDTYQKVSGFKTEGRTLAADSKDALYVVGAFNKDATTQTWLVRKSSDGAKTWNNVDEFSSGEVAVGMDILISSNHKIYVIGSLKETGKKRRWIVRQSTDGGTTWSTVDDFQLSTAYDTYGRGITFDKFGNLVAVGHGFDADGEHMITRRSADGGKTWSTVDTYQYKAKKSSQLIDISRDATGTLFAVGHGVDAKGSKHCIIRQVGK